MAGKAAPAGVSAPQGFDPVLVGQSGFVQPITFPASVTDITLSFPGDFSLGAIDCTTTVGSCAVPVTFSPRYPGLRQSAVIAQDENQNVIGTVFVHGIGLGPQASEHPGVISTAAGNGTWGNGGDGGEATQANLASPQGIAVDTQGRLFIVDSGNEVVRKVSGGIINTIQGTAGLFSAPTGLALDAAGNIYVADSDHNEVLKIDALTRAVTVLAGGGNIGGGNITSGWGDGGPATNAILSGPTDVAVDAAGNVFIADTDHGLIRKVDAAGNISTIAGVAPALYTPQGLALDAGGNLYIADTGHNAIRYMILSTGVVSTIAGTGTAGYSGDSGPALQAQLNAPTGLSVDAAGDVYIADTGNNVIREVLAGSGVITTVAGDSLQGFTPDGGSPLSAQFYGPRNVALDSAGDLFVSDNGNSVVRKITFALQGMNFGTVNVGLTSPAENQTVFNIGNRPLDFSALSIPSNFWQDIANAWVNCSASSVVLPGTGSVISVQFVPTAADTVTENLSFTTNSLNAVGLSQQTANLTGTGAPEAVPKLQLSPASLIFPAQSVGSVSAPQTVVITNIGSAVLNNASVLLSGVGAGSFQFMGGASCGTLQAGQSCSVSVIFSPQATGAQTAVISFTNALANSPQVQVSGTATPVGNLLLPQGASLNVGSALLVMQGDGN